MLEGTLFHGGSNMHEELFCTSGRRFENGLGLNAIRADVIDFNPVSNL